MERVLTCDLSLDCLAYIGGFQLFMNSIRYYPIAGLIFLVFWVWRKREFLHFRIQQKWPDAARIWSEIRYSFATLAIFTSLAVLSISLSKLGIGQIYKDVDQHGWLWIFGSFAILTVWHETWFYWMHRAVHSKFLFKHVHKVHHQSSNPSPFTAYAFHPLEAVLEGLYLNIFTLLVPTHYMVLLIHIAYAMIMNIWLHSGYELYPKSWLKNPITKWLNTSTHHNMHHSRGNYNYSLYFNVWDRLCGTNHAEYETTFNEVTTRRAAGRRKSSDAQAPEGAHAGA